MRKTSETVVFFGSGPVAAASLDRLAEDFSIEAVITKPRPKHHKYPFPVIESANKLGLTMYFTSSKDDLDDLFNTHDFSSPLGIVIDYGIIISKPVIDSFPLGIVNSHFSLLPKYRGADPISFSILSGDSITGVSLMKIVPALDEGPLIAQEQLHLRGHATTPALTAELIELSDQMLKKYLPKFIDGKINPYPQTKDSVSYTRKLNKSDSILDFTKPAAELERQIRAYSEWPRSRTEIGGNKIIITKAHVLGGSGSPGKILVENKRISICTPDGLLVIDSLIPEGKKEMDASAYLAGHQIN